MRLVIPVTAIAIMFAPVFSFARANAFESDALTAGVAERGKTVFERKCTGCHNLDLNREGPRLRGVYGRKAGSVPGFKYSAAMLHSGVIWTDENLERWIRGSDAMLPATEMGFSVPNGQDRADIIEFLKTQN